jgi:hypothetical protein
LSSRQAGKKDSIGGVLAAQVEEKIQSHERWIGVWLVVVLACAELWLQVLVREIARWLGIGS